MRREDFIAQHVATCQAHPIRRYDTKKPAGALHSLEYSRRKCAKRMWRQMQKRTSGRSSRAEFRANLSSEDAGSIPVACTNPIDEAWRRWNS